MELKQPPRNFGDVVFVSLGYGTVKNGRIIGWRVTAFDGQKAQHIEYLVEWFGGKGERLENQEWFVARSVFGTADGGFKC